MTIHRLVGQGKSQCAIFEDRGRDEIIVSASLGLVTMRYNQKLGRDAARAIYRELREKGWTVPPTSDKRFTWSHSDIWEIYR